MELSLPAPTTNTGTPSSIDPVDGGRGLGGPGGVGPRSGHSQAVDLADLHQTVEHQTVEARSPRRGVLARDSSTTSASIAVPWRSAAWRAPSCQPAAVAGPGPSSSPCGTARTSLNVSLRFSLWAMGRASTNVPQGSSARCGAPVGSSATAGCWGASGRIGAGGLVVGGADVVVGAASASAASASAAAAVAGGCVAGAVGKATAGACGPAGSRPQPAATGTSAARTAARHPSTSRPPRARPWRRRRPPPAGRAVLRSPRAML